MRTDLDFTFQACLTGPLAVVDRPVFINRYNPQSLSLANVERMHIDLR